MRLVRNVLLHGKRAKWDATARAMRVAGIACGLCYLHEQYPVIVHRDVNLTNILLDEDMLPHIAGFESMHTLQTPLTYGRHAPLHCPGDVGKPTWRL